MMGKGFGLEAGLMSEGLAIEEGTVSEGIALETDGGLVIGVGSGDGWRGLGIGSRNNRARD